MLSITISVFYCETCTGLTGRTWCRLFPTGSRQIQQQKKHRLNLNKASCSTFLNLVTYMKKKIMKKCQQVIYTLKHQKHQKTVAFHTFYSKTTIFIYVRLNFLKCFKQLKLNQSFQQTKLPPQCILDWQSQLNFAPVSPSAYASHFQTSAL